MENMENILNKYEKEKIFSYSWNFNQAFLKTLAKKNWQKIMKTMLWTRDKWKTKTTKGSNV